MRQEGKLERDELFWHYQLGETRPYGAIRKGDFKLIEFFDDMRVALYNLKDNLGEQHTLAPCTAKWNNCDCTTGASKPGRKCPRAITRFRARLASLKKDVGGAPLEELQKRPFGETNDRLPDKPRKAN